MRMVWPSGALLATNPAATAPPPPPRFSGTNGWPMRSESRCAKMRPRMSVLPPGAAAMTRCTGRLGYGCAFAAPQTKSRARNAVRRTAGLNRALTPICGGELAQLEALDLAGRGARQRVHEVDALRPLEARQVLGRVLLDLVRERVARFVARP